jgi:hypothetical protein
MGKKKLLQGIVVDIIKTDEYRVDEEGSKWFKCIFIVELTRFSKRVREEIPRDLKNARVEVVRWCSYDWHFRKGVRITLTEEETDRVLQSLKSQSR